MSEQPILDEGYYWVVLGQNPPEVAYWQGGEWWLCGNAQPWQPDAVTILKAVRPPRARQNKLAPGMFTSQLLQLARDYLAAFEVLTSDLARQRLSPQNLSPVYFILAHAIELSLKSYLAGRGASENDVEKLGHDLRRILKKCLQQSMPHVERLQKFVDWLSKLNDEHDLRYPTEYHYYPILAAR